MKQITRFARPLRRLRSPSYAPALHAGTVYWDAGSGNWNTGTLNWKNGSAPGASKAYYASAIEEGKLKTARFDWAWADRFSGGRNGGTASATTERLAVKQEKRKGQI